MTVCSVKTQFNGVRNTSFCCLLPQIKKLFTFWCNLELSVTITLHQPIFSFLKYFVCLFLCNCNSSDCNYVINPLCQPEGLLLLLLLLCKLMDIVNKHETPSHRFSCLFVHPYVGSRFSSDRTEIARGKQRGGQGGKFPPPPCERREQ